MKVVVLLLSVVLVTVILCGKEVKANNVFSFKRPINNQQLNKDDYALCPNNRTKCSPSGTCCKTKHNSYHCCRYRHAVCCPDKFHCCPEGSSCNSETKRCDRDNNVKDTIEWKVEDNENVQQMAKLSKSNDLLAKPGNQRLSNLEPANTIMSTIERFLSMFIDLERRCGNSQKGCAGQKKCCAMADKKFGCCSYRKGVCCTDFATCCPHDTQCDLKNKACTAIPENLVPVVSIVKEPFSNCPDNLTKCNSGETCCSVGKVLFGCCPMKDATCCSDKRSCCPHNKKCDIKNNRCVKVNEEVTEKASPIKYHKNPERPQRKSLEIFLSKVGLKTICPDNGRCYEHATCCSVGNGRYGCCPYVAATCCPDLATCCPHNTQCMDGSCL